MDTTQIDNTTVQISGRKAPVNADYVAAHAQEKDGDRGFIVLESLDTFSVVAHKEIQDYNGDGNVVKQVGQELVEEMN